MAHSRMLAASAMTNIPEKNNFYCFFESASLDEILNVLISNGWSSRKSALDEFELTDISSSLELYKTDKGLLLNGRLIFGFDKYNMIIEILKSVQADFTAELYDEAENIIATNNN